MNTQRQPLIRLNRNPQHPVDQGLNLNPNLNHNPTPNPIPTRTPPKSRTPQLTKVLKYLEFQNHVLKYRNGDLK